MIESFVELQGTVEEIVFHNDDNGFTVLELMTDDEYVTAVGVIPEITPGEELRLRGNWSMHQSFGRQFRFELFERKMPSSAVDLYKYLASGAVTGIGAKTAEKIIERFGEDSFDVLENHPEKLTVINGISKNKAEKISKAFNEQFAVRQIMISLERFGMKAFECLRAYKAFGASAVDIIQRNPYELCVEPINLSFDRVEAIAELLPVRPEDTYRQKAGVVHVIKHNLNNGHTCLPRKKLLSPCSQLLEISEDDVNNIIDLLIDEKKIVNKVLNNDEFIFLPYIYDAERSVADRISLLLKFPPAGKPTLMQDIENIENTECIIYDEKQKSAIVTAVEKGLLILTGGPGTGKTTTLNGIIKLLESEGLDVALTAPTGRASKRLSEITGKEAKTIHRLLEVEWDKDDRPYFSRNMKNPIKADAIVIDELSMVDVVLFANLLCALPLGCRVILVGDSNQLPAVGAGNVLHDLIDSGKLPVVELNKVFRQAQKSRIVTNAHSIVNGIMPELNVKDSDFFFLNRKSNLSVSSTVVDLCTKRLPNAYGFSALNDIQILCPSRKGETGSVYLNKALQAVLNPPVDDKNEITVSGKVFREGDKIMQIKNNYDIIWTRSDKEGTGVFNGDIGLITKIDRLLSTVTITFDDDRVAVYSIDGLSEIEHAYAMTVHKSQGNEFDAVVIPVFSVAPKLCYRNLLYTAVTRAKKILVLVGSEDVVRMMTENNSKSKRYSALKDFLCAESNVEDV